jgi:hypothetical protein
MLINQEKLPDGFGRASGNCCTATGCWRSGTLAQYRRLDDVDFPYILR